ncbi:hypothetical protein VNI00_011189 [Paramarasmius palmivorus]|uniref:Transposase n=1 Tax=Paramarasmius palmivorus TaxID=297713 RepID=A0AAW0CGR4_9AGAR
MVNKKGTNQWGLKIYPPQDVLRETLTRYASMGMNTQEKLRNLQKDHSLSISDRKLRSLEKELQIATVRRNPLPKEHLMQAIIDEVDKDLAQRNSANYVKDQLRLRNIMVKRDDVRKIMKQYHPEGFEKRFPGGKKAKIPRTPLTAMGPFHEVSSDGHEKLGSLALDMYDLALPIYGWKDKWTDMILKADVVPDCRSMGAIGHLYLDLLEAYGACGLQHTTDKGSEIGWIHSFQISVRDLLAPQISMDAFPAHVALKSTNHTVIESLWRWLREKKGISIKEHILRGKNEHIYRPQILYHRDLFYWIFPKLVQAELDEFVLWWNNHRVRAQPNKNIIRKTVSQ